MKFFAGSKNMASDFPCQQRVSSKPKLTTTHSCSFLWSLKIFSQLYQHTITTFKIRNDGVRCSSHLSGTMPKFFVILFDYIAIRRLYIFFRLFYDALFTQRKTAVYGEW